MGLDRIDVLARCLKHAVNIAVGAGTDDVVAW
jgi:tRNA pseudouridine-54 N-methylase